MIYDLRFMIEDLGFKISEEFTAYLCARLCNPRNKLGAKFFWTPDKDFLGSALRYDWNLEITKAPRKLLATTTTKAMVRWTEIAEKGLIFCCFAIV